MNNSSYINILILSSYNNVELVRQFQRAKKEAGVNGKVVTSDIYENVPTSIISDKHIYIKPILDEGYIDDIIRACNEENISLVIPLMDKQLKILSKNKSKIESKTKAKVMVSDEDVIDIVEDKFKTYEFLTKYGFKTPNIIREDDIENNNYEFPLFIKPYNGDSSINNFKINNKEELNFFKNYVKNPLIQEFIEGEEYSIDIFTDFNGRAITVVPRLKVKASGGTILQGIIVKNKMIIENMKALVDKLNPFGEINVDCIVSQNEVFILEINGRFGAGASFSFKSGANSPLKLYKLLKGERLDYNEEYEDNTSFIKYNSFFLDKYRENIDL